MESLVLAIIQNPLRGLPLLIYWNVPPTFFKYKPLAGLKKNNKRALDGDSLLEC